MPQSKTINSLQCAKLDTGNAESVMNFLAYVHPVRRASFLGAFGARSFSSYPWPGPPHSVASDPKMQLLVGVTIGPDITIETLTSFTWDVDSPRSWRTASICNSSPCM